MCALERLVCRTGTASKRDGTIHSVGTARLHRRNRNRMEVKQIAKRGGAWQRRHPCLPLSQPGPGRQGRLRSQVLTALVGLLFTLASQAFGQTEQVPPIDITHYKINAE